MKNNPYKLFMLGIVVFLSLTFVSASSVNYIPVNQPDTTSWMEWQVISSTDNLTVEFSDKYSKTSDIWLISPAKQIIETYDVRTARWTTTTDTSNVAIPLTKNVYVTATATIPSKTLSVASKVDYEWNVDLNTSQRITKYGYTIKGNGDKYLKIGEATTIIGYVNQTGGDAWKGYNIVANLSNPPNNPTIFPIFQVYTAIEKAVVSVDNATVVIGTGGGIGGANCYVRQGTPASCSTLGVSECNSYFTYTTTSAVTCQWGGATCNTAQPCSRWGFHQFQYNITKAGATNLTIIVKTTSGTDGNPLLPVYSYQYLYNYTSNSYVVIGQFSCLKSATVPCNLTLSTTNVNDFVSSSGAVSFLIQSVNSETTNMNARYTQLSVDYRDVVVRWRTLQSLVQYARWRSPNQNVVVRWRTS